MDLRSTLLIAFLVKGLQYSAGMYYVEIPNKLWAIKHSCVVIPCSYNYANPKLSSEKIMGIWYHGIDKFTDVKIFLRSRTAENHASFIGDLGNGNCSMKIHNVQPENSKTYRFRVEMDHFMFSYMTYVQLNVLDDPPKPILVFPNHVIPEGTTVTLKCSTTYTCSSDVANLVWSSSEGQLNVTQSYEGEGVWKVESKQVFQVTRNHDGMSFSCHTSYNSGAKSEVIKGNLKINYKPEILQKSLCKRILSVIYCKCVAIAKPPANITWHSTIINVTESSGVSTNSSSNGSETVSRLEGAMIPAGDLWCKASNMEGSVSQNIPIYEKPQIIQESHCKRNLSAIDCECAAIANPPANITWHSTDFNVTETSGFSTNSSSHGSKTMSRIKGAVTSPGGIWCTANNIEGSVAHNLPVHDKPEILRESHCRQNMNFIYCQCVVMTYNSSVSIVWGIDDQLINQTADGFIMTTSTSGNETLATMEGTAIFPGKFWCSARNKGGTELSHLYLHVDWTEPTLISGGILTFLILCIIGAVFVIRRCRSTENKPLELNSYIMEDTNCNNDVSTKDGMMSYQTTKDAEDTYDTVSYKDSENIYMNPVLQSDNEDCEEVYNPVRKEEGKKEAENEEQEKENIYANC